MMKNSLFPVAILAGGLGSRLHPVTTSIPKSMLNIAGEPFIAHQLRLLKKQGLHNIILCLGHLGDQILDYVGDGSLFGLNVRYSFDGDVFLGTGGAIKKALPLLEENFFVLYGDSYVLCPFDAVQQVFIESNKYALMTLQENFNKWDKSNVLYQNGKIVKYSKSNRENMCHIDYGLSVFNQKAFVNDFGCQFDLSRIHQRAIFDNELASYCVEERLYEVGSQAGIYDLQIYLTECS